MNPSSIYISNQTKNSIKYPPQIKSKSEAPLSNPPSKFQILPFSHPFLQSKNTHPKKKKEKYRTHPIRSAFELNQHPMNKTSNTH